MKSKLTLTLLVPLALLAMVLPFVVAAQNASTATPDAPEGLTAAEVAELEAAAQAEANPPAVPNPFPRATLPEAFGSSAPNSCIPDQTIYFSDLEADNGGWTVGGFGDWEWGTPVSGVYQGCDTVPRPEPAGAFSGANVWANNLDGCYTNSGQESTLTQTFDFTDVEAPIALSWQNWYEIFTTFDMGQVYVNGDLLWEVTISTATPDWQQETIDLSAYAGLNNVTVTFRLFATTVVNRMGWYADDIEITGCVAGTDARLAVAHLAPFAMDPGTAVTVTLNATPVLTNFAYGDSTAYLTVAPGSYDVEVYPAGSPTPAMSGTFTLTAGVDYSVIATGDGVNHPLELLALVDDNSAPAAGNFKLRLGHLAPFAAGPATADIRLQDGTPVLTDVNFSDVAPYLELPAGTYDLKITTTGGATTLIDPMPVTLPAGAIVSAFTTGEGSNQPLGAFAWPSDDIGFSLPLAPVIEVTPADISVTQLVTTVVSYPLTISNLGAGDLAWDAYTWNPVVAGLASFGLQFAPAAGGSDGQRGTSNSTEAAPDAYVLNGDFTEGFDDITNLPGWFAQNNSDPLGLIDWFQGNDVVFPAHEGAPTAYLGANFNNTAGVGTISNWMLTPELNLYDGDTFSFWTRTATGSTWPDRLELRLSTAGASTNVGTLATDVGDFTTVLVEVNPSLVSGGYPEVWTQFTATLSGIPNGTTGRFAFRYFVTNGGPSGSNSNYIGIDSVEYVSAAPTICSAPVDVPWVTVLPITGTLAGGESVDLDVTFDSTGLATGVYTGTLCINSNDPVMPLLTVPLSMTVAEPTYLQVAHLAPFAMDPGTAVTVTLNGAPALTNFAYGDSTGYIELPVGTYDVEIFPAGSATPAITATVELMADTYYSAIATGDGVNQPLALVALVDDNSAPTAGTFKLRLGHLAPFAAGDALADIRLQDGTPVLTDVAYADITGNIELPAGTYDLKVTTPGGGTTLIDPLPVTFADGDIITAFATGEGSNQALGVFAWPPDTMGFFLPLFEGYTLYLPLVLQP